MNTKNQNKRPSTVLWLTGLSGSGKTTLAYAVAEKLGQLGLNSYVLDGDNMRQGLCADLGFSLEDRNENIRRIAHINKLFIDNNIIVINAFISPTQKNRDTAKQIIDCDNFIDIYCDCPLKICENHDMKGLYQKARAGLISDFTGIDSIYEPPKNPTLKFKTNEQSTTQCVELIIKKVLG